MAGCAGARTIRFSPASVMKEDLDELRDLSDEIADGRIASSFVVPCFMAMAGSILAGLVYLLASRRWPLFAVHAAVFGSPAVCAIIGAIFLLSSHCALSGMDAGMTALGCLFVAAGLGSLAAAHFLWRPRLDFMTRLSEMAVDVLEEHLSLCGVGLAGSSLSALWTSVSASVLAGELAVVAQSGAVLNSVIALGILLLYIWGAEVIVVFCRVAYSGVFGRWYHGQNDDRGLLMSSFRVAGTTSFGSVCLAALHVETALLTDVHRRLQQLQRSGENEEESGGGTATAALRPLWMGTGGAPDYCNRWAFVQMALRGTPVATSATMTHALGACASMAIITRELLLVQLVLSGSLLFSAVGAACGGAAASASGSCAFTGALLGLLTGLCSGRTVVAAITSGITTILACWAENPSPLKDSHPAVHQQLTRRIFSAYHKVSDV
eukprot:NODE_6883_length_1629_cov_6.832889.p1 GENE.NODE_6883_length_1629_cov_6.832889~~NODE_6883_length_1629_cov_6.832889.p1  ORF type:complete len:464 (+),score=101.18 NODE_6883_length_1629_cov_6.832889:84-1394(+)